MAAVALAVQQILPLLQRNSVDAAPTKNGEKITDTTNRKQGKHSSENHDKGPTSNSFGSDWFARTFYDGGFEEKMSKREAALVLGVRESAASDRIKEAHRKILLLNHPDRGGSAYIAAKINESKDLLLKGKK